MDVDFHRSGVIMAYFTAGFGMLHLLLAGMYGHAASGAEGLGLSAAEKRLTRIAWIDDLATALSAFAVGAIAYFTELNGFAGFLLLISWRFGWVLSLFMKPDPAPLQSDTEGEASPD